MPGFMIVSGYFSFHSVPDFRSAGRRILHAAERYAMPFLTWYFLISVLLLGRCDRNLLTGIKTLFTHVDVGLWFLWVIFVLSIVATCCNMVISRGKSGIFKTVGVIISCIICFGILLAFARAFGINFIGIKYILYYSIFYGFGWLARATELTWKRWIKAKDWILFGCLVVFLAITYNYDLYRCGDDVKSIALRCIAGFAGNAVVLGVCEHFQEALKRIKLDWIGMYTLEIYCSHMYVNNLFYASNQSVFFTGIGFGNFIASLICTSVFTAIIIVVFKSVPAMNWLMYGKQREKR